VFECLDLIINGFLSKAIVLIVSMSLSGFISLVLGFYIGQNLRKLMHPQ
jgi:hypothetical protein